MKRALLTLLILVFALAPLLSLIRYTWCALVNTERAWKIAIGYDRLMNVAFNGSVSETISARANRSKIEGKRWGCILCNLLDKIDKNHCEKSAKE